MKDIRKEIESVNNGESKGKRREYIQKLLNYLIFLGIDSRGISSFELIIHNLKSIIDHLKFKIY